MQKAITPRRARRLIGMTLAACLGAAQAQQSAEPPPTAASAAASSSATPPKDVVLDSAPAVPPAPVAPPVASVSPQDAAISAAVADLGLALMRQQSLASGDAQRNKVLSPLSVAVVMGMVHAGTGGDSSHEIARLLASSSGGDRGFTTWLPAALRKLNAQASDSKPFVMANRVWISRTAASDVPAPFKAMLSERFASDAAIVSFTDANAARGTINLWTAQHTEGRIPQLLPAGAVTPLTRVVATNAMHFKSPWQQPFDPAKTVPLPFETQPGNSKPVPTMVDDRRVRHGTVDNIEVIELPFAGQAYSLLIGMPPAGHTLDALEKDLAGLDIATWRDGLRESNCKLQLPKFSIEGKGASIKPALQALGVRAAFSTQADFRPMLGASAKGAHLDDVFHSATIVIDEKGGEASAATAAVINAKSFNPTAPACAVNRAFVFAVVHNATGLPMFVGKVSDPTIG